MATESLNGYGSHFESAAKRSRGNSFIHDWTNVCRPKAGSSTSRVTLTKSVCSHLSERSSLSSAKRWVNAGVEHGMVVWYDSIGMSGSVQHQNELNANNFAFYLAAFGAIFPGCRSLRICADLQDFFSRVLQRSLH